MEYELGTSIAWRTVDGHWRDPSGERVGPASKPTEEDLRYNTTTGAGQPVLAGPFDFSSAFLRVLPLLARTADLQKLLDETLNDPLTDGTGERFEQKLLDETLNDPLTDGTGERFEVWGPEDAVHAHVYVVATDWRVTSRTNDIGDWNEMALTFYVPVKRSVARRPDLDGVGLFPAYTLADRTSQACTLSELYGIPAIDATFVAPPIPFAPHEPHSLLTVDAEVMPSLGMGQESQKRTVIDVVHTGGPASAERVHLSETAESFCRLLRQEILRKNEIDPRDMWAGRVGALELLTLRRPLLVYTMKEFRDVAQPDRACYQELVQIPYLIEEVRQIEESKQSICVRIHEYPSLPIVTKLGLVAREVASGDGSFVYTVEGVRPFLASGRLSMGNGVGLHYRVDGPWRPVPASPRSEERNGARDETRLPANLEEKISKSNPLHLRSSVEEWLERFGANKSASITPTPWWHRIDPQPVIESILSREWEDRSTTARRTIKRAEMHRRVIGAGLSRWLKDNLKMLQGHEWIPVDGDLLVQLLRHLERMLLALDKLDDVDELDDVEHELKTAWTSWKRANKMIHAFTFYWPDGSAGSPKTLGWLKENRDRWPAIEEQAFMAEKATRAQCTSFARELLLALYPVAEWLVERALDEAVEKLRKPDHCVLRSTAGLERDRLFPLDQSWEDTWYCGQPGKRQPSYYGGDYYGGPVQVPYADRHEQPSYSGEVQVPSEGAPATPEGTAVEGQRSSE
jgi:hypothetical protein